MIVLTFLTNALFILGIYNAFSPGQIMGWFRNLVLSSSGSHVETVIEITKPIYGCFVCMPSVWGTLGFFMFIDYPWYYFPIYVLALSGFMFLIKLYFYE